VAARIHGRAGRSADARRLLLPARRDQVGRTAGEGSSDDNRIERFDATMRCATAADGGHEGDATKDD
jgi:hypothetical protein